MEMTPTTNEGQVVAETVFASGFPSHETVLAAEAALSQLPQVDLQTSHLVHGGMYARTIFVPAGVMLTGALIEQENICICHGDITVTTWDGPQRFTGFCVVPAAGRQKRVGYAHADTWWTAVFTTNLSDVSEIEASLTPEADRLQSRNMGISGTVDTEKLR